MKVSKKTTHKCLAKNGDYAEASTKLTVSFSAVNAMEKKYSGGRNTTIEIREQISDGVYTKWAVSCATGMYYPQTFDDLEVFSKRLQDVVALTKKVLKETCALKAECKSMKAKKA